MLKVTMTIRLRAIILGFTTFTLLAPGCGDFDFPRKTSSTRTPNASTGTGGSGRKITVNGASNTNPSPGTGSSRDSGVWDPNPWPDGGWIPPQQDSTPGTTQPKLDSGQTQPPSSTGECGNAFESEVFKLVNQERAKSGMQAFKCGPLGTTVAHNYAQVMCDKNHFDHTGPDGSSPFERMQRGGINFQTAGENIAAGQQSPQEVMDSWMSSSGHRANILGDFEYIGIGYVPCNSGWGCYWVQVFWM
jgi:uncharacterized protein YkwD